MQIEPTVTLGLQFPALSKAPSIAIERDFEDTAIRDDMENGLVATRPRWSKVRRTFRIPYVGLTPNDAAQLEEFVRVTVKGGAGAFDYILPDTGEHVAVRFAKGGLPKISQLPTAAGIRYNATMMLEEV